MNKLLFIDGNDIHQLYTGMVFKQAGIGVEYLMETENAMELFLVNNYELVIIDLDLHSQKGMELGRKLRQANGQIPIIGITDNYDLKYLFECLNHGMNTCIERTRLLETLDLTLEDSGQKQVA